MQRSNSRIRRTVRFAALGCLAAGLGAGLAVTATGSEQTTPLFHASEPVITYAFVPVGQTSEAKSTTISNIGGGTLDITAVYILSSSTSDFSITADRCTNAHLAHGQTCTISVDFHPTAPGTRVGSLVIADSRDTPESGGQCANSVILAGSSGEPTAKAADCIVVSQTNGSPTTNTVTSPGTTTVVQQVVVQTHLTSSAQCTSKRQIRIHLKSPHGDDIVSARVYIDGHLASSVTSRHVTVVVANLRGKARARYHVRILARTHRGKILKSPARYFVTCVSGK